MSPDSNALIKNNEIIFHSFQSVNFIANPLESKVYAYKSSNDKIIFLIYQCKHVLMKGFVNFRRSKQCIGYKRRKCEHRM